MERKGLPNKRYAKVKRAATPQPHYIYNTEYIQNLVATKGALNPLHFVVLLVGVQGLIEAVSVAIIGGILAKVLSKVVRFK